MSDTERDARQKLKEIILEGDNLADHDVAPMCRFLADKDAAFRGLDTLEDLNAERVIEIVLDKLSLKDSCRLLIECFKSDGVCQNLLAHKVEEFQTGLGNNEDVTDQGEGHEGDSFLPNNRHNGNSRRKHAQEGFCSRNKKSILIGATLIVVGILIVVLAISLTASASDATGTTATAAATPGRPTAPPSWGTSSTPTPTPPLPSCLPVAVFSPGRNAAAPEMSSFRVLSLEPDNPGCPAPPPGLIPDLAACTAGNTFLRVGGSLLCCGGLAAPRECHLLNLTRPWLVWERGPRLTEGRIKAASTVGVGGRVVVLGGSSSEGDSSFSSLAFYQLFGTIHVLLY